MFVPTKEFLRFLNQLDVKHHVGSLREQDSAWQEAAVGPRRGLAHAMARVLVAALNYRLFWAPRKGDFAEVVSVAFSKNQHNALAPVVEQLTLRGVSTRHWELSKSRPTAYFDFGVRLFAGWKTIAFLIKQPGARAVGRSFDQDVYRLYRNAWHLWKGLTRMVPKYVLLSSDHQLSCLLLASMAAYRGICSGYVQHAHVTSNFPCPRYFTHYFLDGEVALRTYTNLQNGTGPAPRLIAVGPARYERRGAKTVDWGVPQVRRQVGIGMDLACTLLTENDVRVLARYPVEFNIRFHPRTRPAKKSAVISLFSKEGVCVTDFPQESSEAFIAQSDAIITGTSSITLDAAFQGVPSLILRNRRDYYGFIREGLAIQVEALPGSFAELSQMIAHSTFTEVLPAYFRKPAQRELPSEQIARYVVDAMAIGAKG